MTRFTTIASTGRRMKTSVNFMAASAVLGPGSELGLGPGLVVDADACAVAQLEGARRHQLVAGLDAVEHRDEVAAIFTEAHELLAHLLDGALAFFALDWL